MSVAHAVPGFWSALEDIRDDRRALLWPRDAELGLALAVTIHAETLLERRQGVRRKFEDDETQAGVD